MKKVKLVVFWIITSLLCLELALGTLLNFNLLNKGAAFVALSHLGYPHYLATILAIGKLTALLIIVLPGFKLIKEWAYTGVVILFVGALLSHQFSGDAPDMPAVISLIITVGSYLLRPENRRLRATLVYKANVP